MLQNPIVFQEYNVTKPLNENCECRSTVLSLHVIYLIVIDTFLHTFISSVCELHYSAMFFHLVFLNCDFLLVLDVKTGFVHYINGCVILCEDVE